jgi:hypothetical protein
VTRDTHDEPRTRASVEKEAESASQDDAGQKNNETDCGTKNIPAKLIWKRSRGTVNSEA